jgi:hypothetical protein
MDKFLDRRILAGRRQMPLRNIFSLYEWFFGYWVEEVYIESFG